MTPAEFYALRGSPYGFSAAYRGFHTGQDYPWGGGTAIPSPASGVVAASGTNDIHGNWVTVTAGGLFLHFCHLVQPTGLSNGAGVGFGDFVGNVGQTGQADGDHLHLAVSTSAWPGPSGERQDPVPVVSRLVQSHGSRFAGAAIAGIEEDDMYNDEDRFRDNLTFAAVGRMEQELFRANGTLDRIETISAINKWALVDEKVGVRRMLSELTTLVAKIQTGELTADEVRAILADALAATENDSLAQDEVVRDVVLDQTNRANAIINENGD
jgi:hypothetical protein